MFNAKNGDWCCWLDARIYKGNTELWYYCDLCQIG